MPIQSVALPISNASAGKRTCRTINTCKCALGYSRYSEARTLTSEVGGLVEVVAEDVARISGRKGDNAGRALSLGSINEVQLKEHSKGQF